MKTSAHDNYKKIMNWKKLIFGYDKQVLCYKNMICDINTNPTIFMTPPPPSPVRDPRSNMIGIP